VTVPVTLLEWIGNPLGIFHDEQGTNWAFVAETAWSWFMPVALITLAITVGTHTAWMLFSARKP
jgi:hypothetical protein